jgi:hypothetical protein
VGDYGEFTCVSYFQRFIAAEISESSEEVCWDLSENEGSDVRAAAAAHVTLFSLSHKLFLTSLCWGKSRDIMSYGSDYISFVS